MLRRAALVLADDIAAMSAADRARGARRAGQTHWRSGAREATVFNRTATGAESRRPPPRTASRSPGANSTKAIGSPPRMPALTFSRRCWRKRRRPATTRSQMLHAMKLGYEIVGRFAQAFPFRRLTVHPHGAFHASAPQRASAVARL